MTRQTMNSSSSSWRRSQREKYLMNVLSPAIKGKTCPICLKQLNDHRKVAVITNCLHAYCLYCIRKWSDLKRKCPLCNAAFTSLFYNISFSSRYFCIDRLPDLIQDKRKTLISEHHFSPRGRGRGVPQQQRSRALPWRRTFGRPGSVASDVIVERKLQWRASVYKRGLKAVPSSPRNCTQLSVLKDGNSREKVMQRIEPWIRRELQVLLQDPDPSVIVHVASSLFISSLEGKSSVRAGQHSDEDNFHAPLRPFLQNWTNMFWHELRCFAETSLTMETYDAVVAFILSD